MTNDNQPMEGDAPRWLRWLVYIMGVALVLGFIVLVGGIAYKASNYKPGRLAPATARSLDLGGAEIQHLSLNGDRLAVSTAHQIVVIDIATGEVISRTDLK